MLGIAPGTRHVCSHSGISRLKEQCRCKEEGNPVLSLVCSTYCRELLPELTKPEVVLREKEAGRRVVKVGHRLVLELSYQAWLCVLAFSYHVIL